MNTAVASTIETLKNISEKKPTQRPNEIDSRYKRGSCHHEGIVTKWATTSCQKNRKKINIYSLHKNDIPKEKTCHPYASIRNG